ncbi:TonB-dependent siderophore receptor, partial [Stutzerimonas nitrititolerans]
MPHLPTPQRTRLNHAVRRGLFAGLLAASPLAIIPVALAQPAASEQTHTYAIPSGPLDQALNRFASEAGILLSVDAQLTAGKHSPGLDGSYSVDEGLARLLAGTGLRASSNDGNYALEVAVDSGDALELEAVTVTGAQLGATTEGTGSYTTGSTSTATRMNLSPRETPQSLSVITRQRIEDQNLANLNDVVQNTPGLTLRRTGPERSSYYSRGFSLDNIMYDGLPTSLDSSQVSQDLLSADMAMYDRVEVVRGATGLMQGAGNPSAAINLIRKRPTREFQASIEGGMGTWDRYRTEVDVSGPLNDSGSVRGRMVTAYQTGNSFRDTLENERTLFYGIMEADLNDSTTLTLSASRQQDNNNGNGWTGIPVGFDGSDLHLSRSTS